MRLAILSPWTGTGETLQDAIRPAVGDAFALQAFEDITGQAAAAGRLSARPSPNISLFAVQVSGAVAAQIAADATWRSRVVYVEGQQANDPDGVPDGTERSVIRARLRADGMTDAHAAAIVDTIQAGATRRQIMHVLRVWFRDRPGA